jgi:hypothetical protein
MPIQGRLAASWRAVDDGILSAIHEEFILLNDTCCLIDRVEIDGAVNRLEDVDGAGTDLRWTDCH